MNQPDREYDILVIGVGNKFRGDDGLGPHVIRLLKTDSELAGVRFVALHGEGTALIETWKQFSHAILIDAFSSGAKPGTLHFIDAAKNSVRPGLFRYSSHSFGVAEAIEVSRQLNALPWHFVVAGIEGVNWELGQHLSKSVSDNVPSLIHGIRNHILTFRQMLYSNVQPCTNSL